MRAVAVRSAGRQLGLVGLVSASVALLATGVSANPFVHLAHSGNITANWTRLSNVYSNNKAYALVFITPNWNPRGVGGVYNRHVTGVWYDGRQWAIYNQGRAPMTNGAAFNVVVANPSSGAFVHRAGGGNTIANWTVIDHPQANGNPYARLLVTANWNPNGVGGVYNNHPIGVWYDGRRWAIYNEDRAPMPSGAAFNVAVLAGNSFIHRAHAANTRVNWTDISHSSTNGDPNAIVFVTANWNPNGVGGVYNNHPVGVWYDHGQAQWAVFNQDLARMPLGASFNTVRLYP
jgi:hypothetical protein